MPLVWKGEVRTLAFSATLLSHNLQRNSIEKHQVLTHGSMSGAHFRISTSFFGYSSLVVGQLVIVMDDWDRLSIRSIENMWHQLKLGLLSS